MLDAAPAELEARAQRILAPLAPRAEIVEAEARVGGGALPLLRLRGPAVAVDPAPSQPSSWPHGCARSRCRCSDASNGIGCCSILGPSVIRRPPTWASWSGRPCPDRAGPREDSRGAMAGAAALAVFGVVAALLFALLPGGVALVVAALTWLAVAVGSYRLFWWSRRAVRG